MVATDACALEEFVRPPMTAFLLKIPPELSGKFSNLYIADICKFVEQNLLLYHMLNYWDN